MTPESAADTGLPTLSAAEARVLGCLVEKAALTPDVYPLTLNAAVVACNQKTSREPVLELDPGVVGHALRTLEDKGLVRVAHGSRALRYEHRMDEALVLTPPQRAVLCLLLLRGPQTPGELLARGDRLAKAMDADEVRATLERLATRNPPLIVRIGRGPGQREDRYAHLLCGPVQAEAWSAAAPAPPAEGDASELAARVAQLEERVDTLTRELADLRARLP
jgi:uncharacterized protein YceH (UPF0502 family)